MEVLRAAADSMIPWLKFTAEVSVGKGNIVPCLDAQLWIGEPEAQQQWFNSNRKDI